MAATMDIFDTRVMVRMLEQTFAVRTFLIDLIMQETDQLTTDTVDIDIVKGKRRMAPFVRPNEESKVVDRIGFVAQTFKIPYIKLKRPTSAAGMLKRTPGDTIYSTTGPVERAAALVAKDLIELRDLITRRMEWMVAKQLCTGLCPIKGESIDAQIDILLASDHKVTNSGVALWTDAASDPLDQMRKQKRKIMKDSDKNATICLMGADATDAFLANVKVQKALNLWRMNADSEINQALSATGASLFGTIGGISYWGYDAWFDDKDPGGTGLANQPLIPDNTVIMLAPDMRATRHFGAIQDLEAGTSALNFFPKSWDEKDPSVRIVQVQSAPAPIIHQPDAFIVTTVV